VVQKNAVVFTSEKEFRLVYTVIVRNIIVEEFHNFIACKHLIAFVIFQINDKITFAAS